MNNPADELCISDPMFAPTGERVAWKHPYKDYMMYSWLYTPKPEALRWDDAPRDSMAVGSSKGGFFYVGLRRTGKTKVEVPRSGKVRGYKAKMLFTADRAGGEEGHAHDVWTDCWLIPVSEEDLRKVRKM